MPVAGLHGGRMSLCPKWLFSDSFLRAGSWKHHRLVLSRLQRAWAKMGQNTVLPSVMEVVARFTPIPAPMKALGLSCTPCEVVRVNVVALSPLVNVDPSPMSAKPL